MTDIEIQRERFEAWFRENYPSWVCFERENGKYTSNAVSMTWDGYLACYQANLEAKAVGEPFTNARDAANYLDSRFDLQTNLDETWNIPMWEMTATEPDLIALANALKALSPTPETSEAIEGGGEKAFREGWWDGFSAGVIQGLDEPKTDENLDRCWSEYDAFKGTQ